jgi:hypothetical protein
MTRTKSRAAVRKTGKGPKLKKETLKDLDAKGRSRVVKGGAGTVTFLVCKKTVQVTCACNAL